MLREIYIVFGLQTHKEIYFHLIFFHLVVSKTGALGKKKRLKKNIIIIVIVIVIAIAMAI